jgi:hypothetical protein
MPRALLHAYEFSRKRSGAVVTLGKSTPPIPGFSSSVRRQCGYYARNMNKATLVRLAAIAAIVGGVLRIADAFLSSSGTHFQQLAYFLTDVMLIFGLCGVYFSRSNRLGFPGLFGFILAITGILMVRSAALSIFGLSAYLVGAAVTLLGVDLISIVMLIRGVFSKLVPALWIASLAFGVLGLFGAAASWAIPLAGITFGVGFIIAGIYLFSDRTSDVNS